MLNFLKNFHLRHNKIFKPSDLEEINIIPLNNSVLLPTMMIPIHIQDRKNNILVNDTVKRKMVTGIISKELKNIKSLEGSVIGGGNIKVLYNQSGQRRSVIIIGSSRYKIIKVVQQVPYLKAHVKRLQMPKIDQKLEMSLLSEIKILGIQWIKQTFPGRKNVLNYLRNLQNLDEFLNFVGSYIFEDAKSKQELLEFNDLVHKFSYVYNRLVEKLNIKKLRVVDDCAIIPFPTKPH